jgi:hypothetical protein
MNIDGSSNDLGDEPQAMSLVRGSGGLDGDRWGGPQAMNDERRRSMNDEPPTMNLVGWTASGESRAMKQG